MYLLDTNVLSELRKADRCHLGVKKWADSVSPKNLWVSVIALAEIVKGISLIERRDPKSALHLEKWLENLHNKYAGRTLPITLEIAEEWGRMNAVRSLPVADSLMAATANVHGLFFVTRDVKPLTKTGVKLLNPFEN